MSRVENESTARPSSKASPTSSTEGGRSVWILDGPTDMLLIVGTPVLIFVLFYVARQVWSAAAVSSFVMIWAIGHHLPGMMRAYGDPDLFRRYRVRFLVAPLFLLAVCCFAQLTTVNSGLLTITAIWGWWHYLMQAYGFIRIYDAKVGSFAAPTRWLDKGMCLTWFAAAVVLNDNVLYQFLENFYNSGIGPPSPGLVASLRSVVSGATAAVTTLFVANLVLSYWRGQSPSPIKVLLMVTTFGAFWYSAATVTNIVVAYAFFELFHDIQYLTIVWAFNRNRVVKDEKLKGFTRFLFQPRLLLIGLYIALIFGYGSLRWGSQYVRAETMHRILMATFLTSTLLHYYFDGFIWKLREAKTQASLGIESRETRRSMFTIPSAMRHGLLWLLFLVPFFFMTVSQVVDSLARKETLEQQPEKRIIEREQLVECAPASIKAHFQLARACEFNQEYDEAVRHYQEALELFPDYQLAKDHLARAQQMLAEPTQ